MDQLVQIPIPSIGVLVLEVRAAGPQLMQGQRMFRLLERVLHTLVDPLVDVVVVSRRVVVHLLGLVVEIQPRTVAALPRAVQIAGEDVRTRT